MSKTHPPTSPAERWSRLPASGLLYLLGYASRPVKDTLITSTSDVYMTKGFRIMTTRL